MKIKLKDLTKEQYDFWRDKECPRISSCSKCMFFKVACFDSSTNCSWVNQKDLYNEKFLNQELEIKVDILDKVEKKYLENILRPFKKRDIKIEKDAYGLTYDFIKIYIFGDLEDSILIFPLFEKDTMYKGMKLDKVYTPEELGLFEK